MPHSVGYCECGCGAATPPAKRTDSRHGLVAGRPTRFLRGHANKVGLPPEYAVEGECWIWQRYIGPNGYGRIHWNGRQTEAHRAYYERYVGPIPAGLHIDHLCRTPACVNPTHLEPVTLAENSRRGSKVKLSHEAAAEIRASTENGPTLARRYGVTKGTIYRVRRGERWQPVLEAA